VSDANTGERLVGANIYSAYSRKGTTTNGYGFYSLIIPKCDSAYLEFSYIGYSSFIVALDTVSPKEFLNINLVSGNILQEVEIKADSQKEIILNPTMSLINLPVSQIKSLPFIAGETDIMKAMQLMPGVQSGNEGSSELYVRGGSPDQNLILLDDVPLYYLNHLGGFVSVFNTDAISNVNLIKGGFPAEYGSRLSSVMDIRMKDGNLREFGGQGSIGLISAKFSCEGPLIKDTASYIISVRRFLLDLISKPLLKYQTGNFTAGYTFYDVNAKLNYKVTQKDRLYLSFFSGTDYISTSSKRNNTAESGNYKNVMTWGNILGALRWNHIFRSDIFSNTIVSYTKYNYSTDYTSTIVSGGNTSEYRSLFNSSINDISIKSDLEYNVATVYDVKIGVASVVHSFMPAIQSYKQNSDQIATIDTTLNDFKYLSFENSAYIENVYKPGSRFRINAGLRFSHYLIDSKNYLSLEPRIVSSLKVSSNSAIKASFSIMQQYVHLLSFSGVGMPANLWVPATSDVPPQKSKQYAIGYVSSLHKDFWELSIESYYKEMNNLITFSEGAGFLNTSKDWQQKIEKGGTGIAYGLEFLIRKKTGRLTGWLAYTLSKTTLQFDNLNNGNPFPYRYDRRHDISLVLNFDISDKILISGSWVYGTGNAITLPIGYIPILDYTFNPETGGLAQETIGYAEIYESKNSFRMRDFHKLDLSISYTKKKKWGLSIWSFSIYNVYNRENPFYYFFDYETVNGITERKLYQQSLFLIIPSVSYSFKF
jgi:hypothetical protein